PPTPVVSPLSLHDALPISAILSNADLATFLDTSDEWILTRTGIRERRISHVGLTDLGEVAARHALAAAGLEPSAIELIVFGTTRDRKSTRLNSSHVKISYA